MEPRISPTRDDIESKLQAVINGTEAREDVDRWAAQWEITLKGTDIAAIGAHIASRVMDPAPDGAVAVLSTVNDLTVGSSILYKPIGSFVLKGVPDEWNLYTVN